MIYLILLLQLLIILLIIIQQKQTSNSLVMSPSKAAVVDTSALIDGRLEAIIKNGFLSQTLLVPVFVLTELQHIADSSNELRRQRGRMGLELVHRLQASQNLNLKIISKKFKSINKVDDKLIALAKKQGAAIITTDYNLNRVASIQNIKVLNVNELAHALRPMVLPGEQISLKIVQRGSDPRQGVGYLVDGTMVVVDNAASLVDKVIRIKVTRIMQTAAGKMLFGQKLSAKKQ